MASVFLVSDAHFPIVVTTYPRRMTLGALPAYQGEYERLLAGERPFVSLVDMRPCVEMPDADVRKSMADWGDRVAEARMRWVLGVAFVVTHPLVRGALTAVHWQTPPRQPTVVVATPAEGLEFLLERLAAAGVEPPPTLDDLRASLGEARARSG